jgi:hypothetical protein
MNIRELLRKINDAVRPIHVQGEPNVLEQLKEAKNVPEMVHAYDEERPK